jgi:hypothetical protein
MLRHLLPKTPDGASQPVVGLVFAPNPLAQLLVRDDMAYAIHQEG